MEEIVRPELAMLSCVGVLITHNDQLTTNFNCFFEPLSSYFFPSFEPLVRYIIVFLFFLNISNSKNSLLEKLPSHPSTLSGCCRKPILSWKAFGVLFSRGWKCRVKGPTVRGVERLRAGRLARCVSGGFGWLTVGLIGTVKIKFKEWSKLRKMCTDLEF